MTNVDVVVPACGLPVSARHVALTGTCIDAATPAATDVPPGGHAP